MKYIDAEKLIAEIDKRLSIFEHGIAYSCWESCKKIVESLQQEQPEVDLEKEIENYAKSYNENEINFWDWEHTDDAYSDMIRGLARHFYELGLNARKGETK